MKVIYIYSGKGGVGKSTICLNLAFSFYLNSLSTGLFDADLYGPNISNMTKKIKEKPPEMKNFTVIPGVFGGVKINSLGLISGPDEGNYWSGKYLEGALYQLVYSVDWQAQVLVVDLPPGSGDIHRHLLTTLPGKVVIVTTPQEVSYSDTIRGIEMLEKLQVDIIGVIENMSFYKCLKCKEKIEIFSGNTQKRICQRFNIPLLGKIPIDKSLSKINNSGTPYVLAKKNSRLTRKIKQLASIIIKEYDVVKHKRPVG